MLSPPKLGTKHLYNSKGVYFKTEQVYFYFLKVKFINYFKMCWLAVNFEICRKFDVKAVFHK